MKSSNLSINNLLFFSSLFQLLSLVQFEKEDKCSEKRQFVQRSSSKFRVSAFERRIRIEIAFSSSEKKRQNRAIASEQFF